MTEDKVKTLIEWFKVRKGKTLKLNEKGIDFVVQVLEEVQAYRKIGLTPELIEAMQGHNIALINDLGEYQKIGTIEEFKALKDIKQIADNLSEMERIEYRALKEKNTPKELDEHNFQEEVHHYLCPCCKNIVSCNQNYCEECGQALET